MLQDLANSIAAIGGWFADPANWSGNDGIPNRMVEHLVLCLLSMVAALLVALPVGLYIGHTGRFSFISVQLANIGRAVPSYAVMALLFPLSIAFSRAGATGGLAYFATFAAMVLLAVPPVVTTTYAGMNGVDGDLREAARGMGMRGSQVLRQVELPLALPVVLTGVRVAAVQVIATATLGAVFGGGGLGRYIIQGFARQDYTRIWSGVLMVGILAIGTELLFAWLVRRSNRRATGSIMPADLDRPLVPAATRRPAAPRQSTAGSPRGRGQRDGGSSSPICNVRWRGYSVNLTEIGDLDGRVSGSRASQTVVAGDSYWRTTRCGYTARWSLGHRC